MDESNRVAPTSEVVLVGAGHAHLEVVRQYGTLKKPPFRLTLINRTAAIPYSGKLADFVAGDVSYSDSHIDLGHLCSDSGARLILDNVDNLDLEARTVSLSSHHTPIPYDILALDLGAEPSIPDHLKPLIGQKIKTFSPLHQIPDALLETEKQLETASSLQKEFQIVCFGSCIHSAELALALMRRFSRTNNSFLRFTYATPNQSLIVHDSLKASEILTEQFRSLNVKIIFDAKVRNFTEGSIQFDQVEIPCDLLYWLTTDIGPTWLKQTALELNEKGFIATNKSLETVSHEGVFATCYVEQAGTNQALSKTNNYGARTGNTLARNIIGRFFGLPQTNYDSTKNPTIFVSLDAKRAMIQRGKWAFASGRIWSLKDGIDCKWLKNHRPKLKVPRIATFLESGTMSEAPCGGEGAAIPTSIIDWLPDNSSDTSGVCDLIKDAHRSALHIRSHSNDKDSEDTHTLISSQRQFVDDIYTFGQLAASQALAEIHAQGNLPISWHVMPETAYATMKTIGNDLYELVSGCHSILAVSASDARFTIQNPKSASEAAIHISSQSKGALFFDQNPLKLGDRIILSKPLGTGAILAGYRHNLVPTEVLQLCFDSMKQTHTDVIKRLSDRLVKATIAVGGHGLAQSLVNVTIGSNLICQIYLEALPALTGAIEILDQGIRSSIHTQNRLPFTNQLNRITRNSLLHCELLFDPQTAGGIIFVASDAHADQVLKILNEGGFLEAKEIGTLDMRKSHLDLLSVQ